MNTYIVLPAYNESNRVVKTLRQILRDSKLPVVVVDDGSTDDTFSQLKRNFKKNPRVILLKHIINLGKGSAMKTGIECATINGADSFIFIDADGQHNPAHLKMFQELLRDHDIVFGYRDLGKKMPVVRRCGNILAKWLIKKFFKIDRKDLLCGYLAFKLKVYDKLIWQSSRYGVETEMAVNVGKNKIKFCENKIDTIYINKYKGVTIFDAFRILIKLPFWYFEK